MKRRDFLRRFGIGVAAAAAAPSVVKGVVEGPSALPEPADEYIDHAPPKHTPNYETVTNVDSEYYTDIHSRWSKAQMEAASTLTRAMDCELFLGTGQM